MNPIELIVVVVVLALVALLLTFVLFRYLDSFAQGQSEVMGATIKYGGALGGFVLILSLLSVMVIKFSEIETLMRSEDEHSSYSVNGVWQLQEGSLRDGCMKIEQHSNSRLINVVAILEDDANLTTTMVSLIGEVVGNRIYFVFQSSTDEVGLAIADLIAHSPKQLTLNLEDLAMHERDGIKKGKLHWKKPMNQNYCEEKFGLK